MKVSRRETNVAMVFFGCVGESGLSQRVNGVRSSLCKCGTRNECMYVCVCVCVCVTECDLCVASQTC